MSNQIDRNVLTIALDVMTRMDNAQLREISDLMRTKSSDDKRTTEFFNAFSEYEHGHATREHTETKLAWALGFSVIREDTIAA